MRGFKIRLIALHLLSGSFSPVSVKIEENLEGGNQDFLDPCGEDFKVLYLSIVQLGQLKSCSFEGLIDEDIFTLFVEIQFADCLVERGIETQSIFKILDEIFDELFGELYFIFEECLKIIVDSGPLFDTQ